MLKFLIVIRLPIGAFEILVEHILNPEALEIEGADINDDGDVNILDIVQLVNIILN